VRIDNNTIVVLGALDGDETAMDFLGYAFRRTCKRIAETATSPSNPL
jgi:hypothetical protein